MKKIKFQKLKATNAFIKLFGLDRSNSNTAKRGESDAGYEYYYKRGSTYYFRDADGNKISVNYNEPHEDLIRGNRYNIADIDHRNG